MHQQHFSTLKTECNLRMLQGAGLSPCNDENYSLATFFMALSAFEGCYDTTIMHHFLLYLPRIYL